MSTIDSSPPLRLPITLVQFLKLTELAETGGQVKGVIRNAQVTVNGTVETRPGRTLAAGDVVAIGTTAMRVVAA